LSWNVIQGPSPVEPITPAVNCQNGISFEGERFELSQAYKNGVMIWHPDRRRPIDVGGTRQCSPACIRQGVTPFVFMMNEDNEGTVYHPPRLSGITTMRVLSASCVNDSRSRHAEREIYLLG